MMKRIFDFTVSFIGLVMTLPLTIPVLILIWIQDFKNPFYIAPRVGRKFKTFRMIKFRSMVVNADKTGVQSTSAADARITPIGNFVRKYKMDELSQFLNVFIGDMSFVGPRPQVRETGTDLYTDEEKRMLDVKPGITDFASIVFSDEGNILKDSKNPNLDYNRLIRPWKSRLALLYVDKRSFFLDIKLMILTAVAIISKQKALVYINEILINLKADPLLIEVCKREKPLIPYAPPGTKKIVDKV